MKSERILLADDHNFNRIVLATGIREQGYQVIEAENGRQVLEFLEQEPIDLILLDLIMPVMDGFEVLQAVRENPDFQHLPIIVISNLGERENIIRSLELGATDYVSKPVDPAILKARIKSSLNQKHLYDLQQDTQNEFRAQKEIFQELFAVTQVVNQSLSLEGTLSNILRASISLTKAHNGSLWLLDENQQITPYYLNPEDNLIIDHFSGIEKGINEGMSGWVMKNQQPALIKDTATDSRWVKRSEAFKDVRSVLCVPVSFKNEKLGILTLFHTQPNFFQADALGLLMAAADQISATLHNSQLYERERQLRKALEASEGRYKDLFDNAQELIQGVDEDGRFLYVNQQWQKVLGYSEEEARQMNFEQIIHPSGLDQCRQVFQQIQSGNPVPSIETSFITRTGEQIFVEGNISVRTDETNRFFSTRGIFRDVTYRKEAESALQKSYARTKTLYDVSQATSNIESLPQLMQTVVESIASALPADRVTLLRFDPALTRVIGFVKGGSGHSSIHKVDIEELKKGLTGWVLRENKAALSPKGSLDERESEEVQRRRAATNCGSIIVVPLQYRDLLRGTITAINTPDQPDFTEADVDLMTAMGQQVLVAIENARLYKVERDRVRELADYVDELDTFAGTVAHDLKTPLSNIIGFTRLLPDLTEDEKLLHILDIIQSSSTKMSYIIDDLLFLARVRQQSVPITPVDVYRISGEAVIRQEYTMLDSKAKIIWANENWPPALGYAGWIEEVWSNYISNAIKYGGKPPVVELGATRRDNGMVRYWVKDNGEGLTPENRAKLFTQFERLDKLSIKGHGLGLTIVKRIVEKLGGQVGIEDHDDQGSIFYFDLPAIPATS